MRAVLCDTTLKEDGRCDDYFTFGISGSTFVGDVCKALLVWVCLRMD